jgi:type III pantothenate kinase
VKKIIGKVPMIVGPGVKTGLNIHMDNPRQVGSDLIVDAVAGIAEYGAPLVIIDMGTATTLSVVDDKRSYIGGQILPGLRLSMEALSSGAAQLYNVGLEAPKQVIGKNTSDCMRSGLIIGNAACIDGMIDRIEEELGYPLPAIATGGLAKVVIPLCRHEIVIDDTLLLKGLKIIYDKNKD